MAKRQSTETPQNVVRIDGEGKTHANGGKITPLCKLRGHGEHTWVTTDEPVDCQRCVSLEAKQQEARKRLEYATRAAETQDEVMSQAPAYFQEPKHSKPLPAVEPVKDSQGATVTVPVDYDNPTAGRRELDASKGERVIGETTFRESAESIARRERARDEYMRATRAEAPQSAEAVQALIRRLQTLHSTMTGEPEGAEFSVTFHEPKNGPALEREIPAMPEGVSPNVWELAFTANTESAREYWTRKAKEERTAFLDAQEAMEESRKVVELDTPPF